MNPLYDKQKNSSLEHKNIKTDSAPLSVEALEPAGLSALGAKSSLATVCDLTNGRRRSSCGLFCDCDLVRSGAAGFSRPAAAPAGELAVGWLEPAEAAAVSDALLVGVEGCCC